MPGLAGRRALVLSLLAAPAAVLFPGAARARTGARVGYLDSGWDNRESARLLEAFRQGLRDAGYREGTSLSIEYRWAEGDSSRLPELAADLARRGVDAIVAAEGQAARAAQRATAEIPIVMAAAVDPVGFGLVKALARPGGNVTGLANISPELTGKHLELLKETAPGISRVAVLWNAANPAEIRLWRARQAAARALRLELIPVEVRSPEDVGRELSNMTREHPQAIHLFADPLLLGQRGRILEFAALARLPIVSDAAEITEAGGLFSFGAYMPDLFRRAARFVAKILHGERPSLLPVEQPTRFELVINARTAERLGIAIAPSVLVLADRVVG